MNDGNDYRVEDRLKIAEVLYTYCRAIDRIDIPLLRSVFEPDAIIDKGRGQVPVADWIDEVAERHPTVEFASHMVTNHLIDFISPYEAFCEAWCLAVERFSSTRSETGRGDLVVRVRYADSFRKSGDTWRIAKRVFLLDHAMSVPVRDDMIPSSGLLNPGTRGPQDLGSTLRRQALDRI